MNKYELNYWEEMDILSNTSQERKQKVVDALNIAMEWLKKQSKDCYVEIAIPPTIVLIINDVDATEEEVLTICKELNEKYKGKNFETVSEEDLFICAFCKEKIKQLSSN